MIRVKRRRNTPLGPSHHILIHIPSYLSQHGHWGSPTIKCSLSSWCKLNRGESNASQNSVLVVSSKPTFPPHFSPQYYLYISTYNLSQYPAIYFSSRKFPHRHPTFFLSVNLRVSSPDLPVKVPTFQDPSLNLMPPDHSLAHPSLSLSQSDLSCSPPSTIHWLGRLHCINAVPGVSPGG